MTRALDEDADRPATRKASGRAMKSEAPNRPGACGADQLLHDEGRVGADHDHLAMGHVDDAHGAEGDRETDGREQQNGAEARRRTRHSGPRSRARAAASMPSAALAAASSRSAGVPAGRLRRSARASWLPRAREDFDSRKLVWRGGVGLVENDRGASALKRAADMRIALLSDGLFESRQSRDIARAEDGAGGSEARVPASVLSRVEAAERGLDGAANAVVERERACRRARRQAWPVRHR